MAGRGRETPAPGESKPLREGRRAGESSDGDEAEGGRRRAGTGRGGGRAPAQLSIREGRRRDDARGAAETKLGDGIDGASGSGMRRMSGSCW
jgi:hypothetical protein